MSDRPITFSASMVRALLAGRKTQTRRLLSLRKYRGFSEFGPSDTQGYDWHFRDAGMRWHDIRDDRLRELLPYRVGDRLYVREHWKTMALHDKVSPSDLGEKYRKGIYSRAEACPIEYLADGTRAGNWAYPHEEEVSDGWKPGRHRQAMHMPRWASRLTLSVREVHVERLQDISRADAIAEGLTLASNVIEEFWKWPEPYHENRWLSPVAAYRHLWDQINGEAAWDANPFVVAISFRVERGNIDQIARAA